MKALVPITALLASTFFVAYGLLFLVSPFGWFYIVTKDELDTATGLIDVRSTYGGMTIAVGVFIGFLYRRNLRLQSMLLIGLILSCMAASRLLGMVLDGPGNGLMDVYLVLEIIGSVLALVCARKLNNAA